MTLTLNRQLLTSARFWWPLAAGLTPPFCCISCAVADGKSGRHSARYSCASRLSANADAWVTHCENVCQQWQCRWWSNAYNLRKRGWGLRPNAAGALSGICPYPIARRSAGPAQHLDDQCETFLLALKRGSALPGFRLWGKSRSLPEHGLSPVACPHAGGTGAVGIGAWFSWIEDESNQDDSYDRNFLRLA